ncbi:MAG: ABC transporter substrate-binding protein [Dehalococcoidia bacterium]|jgi:branched-chain amino acid transport system substrate-binding protein
MKRGKLVFLIGCAVLLAVSSVAVACTSQPAAKPATQAQPAATAVPTMIKIGMGDPLTGPYATTCTPIFNGCKDYLTWVNDNGGLTVNGKSYKFDIEWADTKGDVPTGLATYKRFVEDGCPVFEQSTTAEASAQNPVSLDLKVPIIGSGGTDDQQRNNDLVYVYMFDVPYQISNPIALQWYHDNMWKGTGRMKVARLYVDLAMGKIMDTQPVNDLITQGLGYDLLPVEWFPATITDFTPYLLRIKDENPDVVLCQCITDPFALALKDAVRLGMDVTKPQFIGCEWAGINSAFLKSAGPVAEGSISSYYYKNFWDTLDNANNPDIQKELDVAQKYQNTRRPPENYAKGYGQGVVIRTAIERALQNSGSATKESVQAELTKFSNVDIVVTGPVTWTNCQRDSLQCGIVTVKNGALTPLTPPNLQAVPGTKDRMGYLWGGGCKASQ